jgi:hypothetical protein
MKKIIQIMLLAGLLVPMLTACDNDDKKNIFPEGYDKILALKENGVVEVDMNTTQSDVNDSILIMRGGANPKSETNLTVQIMSKSDAAEAWGYKDDELEIIPSDAYKLVGSNELSLSKDDEYKYIPLVYNPLKIYNAMKTNKKAVWVLPLYIESKTATINSQRNKVLIKFAVKSPLIEWKTENMDAEIIYKNLNVNLNAAIANSEDNKYDFTCDVSTANAAKLVEEYNDSMGTHYEVLPEKAYSINKFSFVQGSLNSSTTLSLSRNGLTSDHTYLLPIQLGSLSNEVIDKSDKIIYVVVTCPKYVCQIVDRTIWKIAFANTQDTGIWSARSLFDNNYNTEWSAHWSGAVASADDFDYDDAYFKLGYPACRLRRDVPNMALILDLGRKVMVAGIGVAKMAGFVGDQDLKDLEIYMADNFTFKTVKQGGSFYNYNNLNDGNSWHLALTYKDIPRQQGTFWYNLSESDMQNAVSGRYLKFHPTAVYRSLNACQCAELFIKEIISIDGNPVE